MRARAGVRNSRDLPVFAGGAEGKSPASIAVCSPLSRSRQYQSSGIVSELALHEQALSVADFKRLSYSRAHRTPPKGMPVFSLFECGSLSELQHSKLWRARSQQAANHSSVPPATSC